MFTSFGVTNTETEPAASAKSHPQPQPQPPQSRAKRAQVARACDWCRLGRVKCDSERPCRACKQAGRECKNAGLDEFRGVGAATREVHRLRAKVQELEGKLLDANGSSQSKGGARPQTLWTGVRLEEMQYGPSSLKHFTHRLGTFTDMDLSHCTGAVPYSLPMIDLRQVHQSRLRRPQQDYFLDLFWQGHHVVYPVIDETSFREHYDGLWEDESTRRGSPLVDIVLALCIQSYMSSNRSPSQGTAEGCPGDEYYQRVHCALTRFADKAPSLTTVQCCFFSVIYLIAKGHTSSAAVLAGTAIQSATAIGLHNEALSDNPHLQVRARLWSCLRAVDMQLSMHLGRPSTTAPIGNNVSIVTDDATAHLLGPTYIAPPAAGVNWLSFQRHHQELVEVVHTIHTELYKSCEEILRDSGHGFYEHPQSREKCAQVLAHHMKKLNAWVDGLPAGLKTPRRNGKPFSTDRSSLDLTGGEPLWLQRQRIILELEYHQLYITLARPFICFQPTPALGTLTSDNHCIASLDHALATTNIIHQLLSETDIIAGWYQLFYWQITAVFIAAGFACGYPVCNPTASARKSLETAAVVGEMLGLPEMALTCRNLDTKAGEILAVFKAGLGITPSASSTAPSLATGDSGTGKEETPASVDVPTMDVEEPPETVGGADLWLPGDPSESLLWGDFIKDVDPELLDQWNWSQEG